MPIKSVSQRFCIAFLIYIMCVLNYMICIINKNSFLQCCLSPVVQQQSFSFEAEYVLIYHRVTHCSYFRPLVSFKTLTPFSIPCSKDIQMVTPSLHSIEYALHQHSCTVMGRIVTHSCWSQGSLLLSKCAVRVNFC